MLLTVCLRKEGRKENEGGLQPAWTVKLLDWAVFPAESLTSRMATAPTVVLSAMNSAEARYYIPAARVAVHRQLVPVSAPKSTSAGALGSSAEFMLGKLVQTPRGKNKFMAPLK